MAERATITRLLNECKEIREGLSRRVWTGGPDADVAGVAGRLAAMGHEALVLAQSMHHEHGAGLAKDMFAFGRMWVKFAEGKAPSSTDADGGDDAAFWAEIEQLFLEAKLVAKDYADIPLALRALEGLTNVYKTTNQLAKELKTSEVAATIMESQDMKTVGNTVALLGAYTRALTTLKRTEDGVNTASQAFLELTFKSWDELMWLSSVPSFNFPGYLMHHKTAFYHLAISVGDLLSSQFLTDGKPEDLSQASAAYELALRIGAMANDSNWTSIAHIHQIRAFYKKCSASEFQSMKELVKQMAENMDPPNPEVMELLAEMQGGPGDPTTTTSTETSTITETTTTTTTTATQQEPSPVD
ncbi:hypothetical protein Pelo_5221 [Pelomyxa schiedti]|nr:hypothetical protein Pelo_5221 [Pelomyxa schiedti]